MGVGGGCECGGGVYGVCVWRGWRCEYGGRCMVGVCVWGGGVSVGVVWMVGVCVDSGVCGCEWCGYL